MSGDRQERETVLSQGGGGAALAAGGRVPPGEVVAGYTVGEVAGEGGMGVVYRASDPELGRTVALKLIAPARSDDPRLRDLFVDESLTAAGLEHPNVIPIYRAGEDHGRLYIAMRYVEGSSLQDLIAAAPGGLPPGRAARIVARVAEALDAAHARGLVHRDVKPGNILIADPEGEEHVYLTDFGLTVRGAGPAGHREGWTGTLAYLSPEQIRGGPLDGRTDVYALGCVLYHALTGRPPFSTDDEQAALTAHLTQRPPAPSEVVPGLPPAMDEVVRRAMAKRPEDRYQSAGELGRAALAARYDAAVLARDDDLGAAQAIAGGLAEEGLHPFLAPAGDAQGVAEGVRASGGCAVLVGRAGLGDWAREGLAAAREMAARDRAFRLVLVLLPGGPDPGDPSLAFLATHPWVDLRAGTSDALAVRDIVRALRGADVAPGLGGAPSDVCPYRGLDAFREEDADLFFGREQDTARLVQHLRSTRFLAVLGASGSGKSSLVQAGLIPAVRRGALPAGEAWRVIDLVPGPRPLSALAARLAQLPGAGAPSSADLAADERGLDLAGARALEGRPAGERVLVVVDQLEEAFTLCPDEGERAAFLGNLVYAATIPGGRAVVVVAMRADFYHRLAEHPGMRALAAAQQMLVGPMDARGLRRAIEEPAKRAGLELEPGLTRRILTDVADRPGTLPLLEYLLLELWQRRRGRMLTLEAYAASGGVEGALARRANAVYGGMSPERQAVARRVLLRLTVPGEGTEDTRRRADVRELVTRSGEEPEVEAVVSALAEARLLTTGRDDATGEPVVEVTHEALIRGWPELRGWINDDREQLRQHRRLSDAAAEWDASGREEGQLYRGARLATWQERDRSDLNELERDFLAASQERAEAERATRRRRTRIAIGALATVAVIVAGLAIFAFVQRGDAADQRDLAHSRELAASARLQLPTDPELALLLAEEAYDVDRTPRAEEILRQATFESRVRAALRENQGPVLDVAYEPDGGTVVVAGDDGTMRLWEPESGNVRTIDAGQGPLRAVAISPDGRETATAGEDGTVRVWDASGQPDRVLRGHQGGVNALAFRPDGRSLASAGDDGTVRIWRVSDGRARVIRAHEGGALSVAFSPDGRRLASGGADSTVRVWRADGTRAAVLSGAVNVVAAVAFSPDGRRLAGGDGDGTVRIWTLGAGQGRPLVLRASQAGGALSVAFSPDGRHMLTSGSDGTVRVWEADGTALTTLRGHEGQVQRARFSPDGSSVLSAGDDGSVRVWAWAHGLPAAEAPSAAGFPSDGGAEFGPAGRLVLSVGLDGSLSSWNTRAAKLTQLVPGDAPGGFIYAGAVSPDGQRFAIARSDGSVAVRSVAGGQPSLLRGHDGPVWSIGFSDDGRFVVTGGEDGTVRLWDLRTGTASVLTGHSGSVFAVDLSSDGTTAVSGGADGTVRVWDVASGSQSAVLRGHEGTVLAVDLSPDGTRVVSSGDDRSVRLWRLPGGESTVLRGHQGTVYAGFGPDGTRVVSTSDDGVRVWDTATGAAVLEIPASSRDTFRAELGPDGTRLAVQVSDGRIRIYPCETCGSIEEVQRLANERVTRELTPAEREAFAVDS
jgi:WD40 repeat protein